MFNRKTIFLLIFIPVLYTLLFGGLFSPNVITAVPIVLCNLDDGFDSQRLIKDLYDTPEVEVVATDIPLMEADDLLKKYQAVGVVIIPKDFSKRVNVGNAATVELVIDNTNRMLGGTVSKAVQSVVTAQSSVIAFKQRIVAGWSQPQAQGARISLSSRILFNPTNGYIDFFLAALIVHSTQIAIVFTLTPTVIARKENFLDNPIKALSAMVLSYSAIMVGVIAICLAVGMNVFHMVCRGNGADILLLCTAFIFCMVNFALCVGAWFNEPYKALMTPLVYVMPSILFANVTWSRTSMDSISLFLSYIMPIGYIADDLRSLFVKGVVANLNLHVAILLAMGIIFFMTAVGGVKYHV